MIPTKKRRLLLLILALAVISIGPLPLVWGGAFLTRWLLFLLVIWAAAAYLLIPRIWKLYFRRHTAKTPEVTCTKDGHPGDPVNLLIEGSEELLIRAMTSLGWYPANPITFLSSVRIVKDTVFRKPDNNAPVSNLFLFGRKQDLAFELPEGKSPRQRHHVRFWQDTSSERDVPLWYGAATFDSSVGLSHTTGQVTHHIGPEVDADRDLIMNALREAGWTQEASYVAGFHQQLEGRHGGGDRWRTDGRLGSVVLSGESHPNRPPSSGK